MNAQEILKNLKQLEAEVQNIKSARIRIDNTIGPYRETRKEIAKLINGMGQVTSSLCLLAREIKGQDATLSEMVKEAVRKIEKELWAINNTFEDNCAKPNASLWDYGQRIMSVGEALQLRAILQQLRNI